MVNANSVDCIAPTWLVIPFLSGANVWSTSAPKGSVAISGAKLVFYSGSKWELVTSS